MGNSHQNNKQAIRQSNQSTQSGDLIRLTFDTDDLGDRQERRSAKIIVMGNQQVGKTSIIRAFTANKTMQTVVGPSLTVTDQTKTVRVEDENGVRTNLRMRIWDAAGDNNINNLAHLFVRDVQCGILVYAINS